MTSQQMNKLLMVIVAILALLLITSEVVRQKEKFTNNYMQEALKDSLKVSRNSEGKSVGSISVINAPDPDYFLNIASKDSMIIYLQNLVKKYKKDLDFAGGSAIVIASETNINSTSQTTIDSTDKKSPIYLSDINLKDNKGVSWVTGNTVAKSDSTIVNIKIRDNIDLLIKKEKTGFLGLGRGKYYGEVTFHNPFNEVKDMKVYQTNEAHVDYWHIGPTMSYGMGSDWKPQLYLGIGIMWTPINF